MRQSGLPSTHVKSEVASGIGQCLRTHVDATSVPAIFNAASRRPAFGLGAYIQLPFSFLALSTFKDRRLEGCAAAYSWIRRLTRARVFVVFFSVVCRRTGMCLKRSVTRTVVPTG